MKYRYLFAPMILFALACGRPPHVPPLATTVAVVEFGVAPNAKIERFSGDPPSLGVLLAKAAAEEIRDDNDDDKPFDATVVPRAAPAEGDLIVRGEITHVYGGNGWVQATVLVCTVCGWWTGNPRLGFQGTVTRRDGTVVAAFSDETTGLA